MNLTSCDRGAEEKDKAAAEAEKSRYEFSIVKGLAERIIPNDKGKTY